MVDKLTEIVKDFGYGLVITAGMVAIMYAVIQLITLFNYTKEQGSNFILALCFLFVVYSFGSLVRYNLKK
jgi:hypothetical protein|tara:strand:+ start:102 stop:311 length:210 start_codon:yes stop_codon:yes gene_type:complete